MVEVADGFNFLLTHGWFMVDSFFHGYYVFSLACSALKTKNYFIFSSIIHYSFLLKVAYKFSYIFYSQQSQKCQVRPLFPAYVYWAT